MTSRQHRIDTQKHRQSRSVLRVIGPLVLAVGIVFVVIGFGSLFNTMRTDEPPYLFWCAFVGLPTVFVGMILTKMAYMGAIGRFVSSEISPVAKDTFNYMADGTKDSIRDLAGAVGQGISNGLRGQNPSNPAAGIVPCPQCGQDNEGDARFCDQCGAELQTHIPCPKCGDENKPDARFCDNCGQKLGN